MISCRVVAKYEQFTGFDSFVVRFFDIRVYWLLVPSSNPFQFSVIRNLCYTLKYGVLIEEKTISQ